MQVIKLGGSLLGAVVCLILLFESAKIQDEGWLPLPSDLYLQEKNIRSKDFSIKNLSSITALDENTLVAMGWSGTIVRSTDKGLTFTPSTSSPKESLRSITALDENTLVAVGGSGAIVHSTDKGLTFRVLDLNQSSLSLSSAVVLGERVFIVGESDIILSYDIINEKISYLYYQTAFSVYFFVFLIGSLICASLVFWFWRNVRQEPASNPENQLSNDTPVSSLSADSYNMAVLAQTIASLIMAPKTQAPLSIAINAPWGSGKSSLALMTHSILHDFGVKVVSFNLWYHEEEKHLLASLMQTMLKDLTPNVFSLANIVFRWKLFYYRVLRKPDGLIRFLLFMAGVYYLFLVMTSRGFENLAYVGVGAIVFVVYKKAFNTYTSYAQQIMKYKKIFHFKDFEENIGLRDEFLDEMKQLVALNGRTVLFLDDLDRCQDDEILKIMKTVNYLTSIPNLFIIMAVDKSKILNILQQKYNSDHISEQYLEKIFNLTINIPATSDVFYEKYQLKEEEKIVNAISENSIFRCFKSVVYHWLFAIVLLVVVGWNLAPLNEWVMGQANATANILKQVVDGNTTTLKNVLLKSAPIITNNAPTVIEDNPSTKPPLDEGGVVSKLATNANTVSNRLPYVAPHIAKRGFVKRNIVTIIVACLGIVFIGGVLFVFYRKRDHYEAQLKQIDDFVRTQQGLSPRERNLLTNKVFFYLAIGAKRYFPYFPFIEQWKFIVVQGVLFGLLSARFVYMKYRFKTIQAPFRNAFLLTMGEPLEENAQDFANELEKLKEDFSTQTIRSSKGSVVSFEFKK